VVFIGVIQVEIRKGQVASRPIYLAGVSLPTAEYRHDRRQAPS
jgi:hypothetical protein